MLVASRIFRMYINGEQTNGMVPYADMLNHQRSSKAVVRYYCDKWKGFILEAAASIPKGEQIFDNYGSKCNSRFFLNYGFINPNNDANELRLLIKL